MGSTRLLLGAVDRHRAVRKYAIPFGWAADRFGRKPQLFVWSGAIALLMVPVSTLIRPEAGFGSVLVVFCFGLGVYATKSSIAPAIMSELFPTKLRCLGIGAWYNLTVALFGGTAPLVIQWLGDLAPAAGSSGTFRSARPSRSSPRSPSRRQGGWCSSEPRHRPSMGLGP